MSALATKWQRGGGGPVRRIDSQCGSEQFVRAFATSRCVMRTPGTKPQPERLHDQLRASPEPDTCRRPRAAPRAATHSPPRSDEPPSRCRRHAARRPASRPRSAPYSTPRRRPPVRRHDRSQVRWLGAMTLEGASAAGRRSSATARQMLDVSSIGSRRATNTADCSGAGARPLSSASASTSRRTSTSSVATRPRTAAPSGRIHRPIQADDHPASSNSTHGRCRPLRARCQGDRLRQIGIGKTPRRWRRRYAVEARHAPCRGPR